MAAIAMCASVECIQSKLCYRHPDSGTKPDNSQSWALYEAQECTDFWPITAPLEPPR